MDKHADMVKWLRDLGYNKELPENLTSICNNSTKFVWEQLMQNVRPRQEVENIRRNLILNRLKMKSLSQQDNFAYKIKEIEAMRQKLAAEEKFKNLDAIVQEKRYKVDQLSQQCKMKDVSVDFLRKKINENEQRQFLLDGKKKQLELQNLQAKATLRKLKNVTPVEREDSSSAKDITETLEKCAGELNKLLLERQKCIAEKLYQPVTSHTVKKKSQLDGPSVATYLSMREQENFEEIARTCRKKDKDKENVDANIREARGEKVRQKMFTKPQVIIEQFESTEKNSFEQLGVGSLPSSDNSDADSSSLPSKPNKRESLGLLPDSCLDELCRNDSFLCSTSDKCIDMFEKSSCRKVAEAVNNSIQTELYRNVDVNRDLEILLRSSNRELVYETLLKCIRNVEVELTKALTVEKVDGKQNKINENDIAKLNFIHVQTELKIVEQKKFLRDLVAKIAKRKVQLLDSIKSQEARAVTNDKLDLQIKQVAIDASLAAMKKQINDSIIMETSDNDMKVLLSKIAKIKHEIANKIHLVKLTRDDLGATHKDITATRESVLSAIWHIQLLRMDTYWMNPLLENAWLEEMRVFDKFPLEYQRRCIHTEPKSFYRDLCVDNYPRGAQTDSDTQLLSQILESPWNPPETILLNVIKAHMKLNVLKSMSNGTLKDSFARQHIKRYSFEELQRQESYLEFALDRLNWLMSSSNAGNVSAVGEIVKQAMDLWTDLPMREIISDKRQLDGQPFQYYCKKLEGFL